MTKNGNHNENKAADQKEFSAEQAHLDETWRLLADKKTALAKRLEQLSQTASEEKKDMRDNYTMNFASDTDSMETWGELEVMNHNIDRMNIESDSANEKLGRLNKLLQKPYFARVRLQFSPDEEPEDYYIGIAGMEKDGYNQLVIDWRSPIAETYYNQDNGKTFYKVNGKVIPVDLLLRRQFDLDRNVLHSYFDTSLAIEDPMLLQSLSKRRSDQMQAITITIQKEQNAVIRFEDVPVLLVNGIAGSGKTSVLLQRIAYLFYQKRESLDPQNVFLLTLNPVFGHYIANVLPEMGERNPVTATWNDFLQMVEVPDRREDGFDTPSGILREIDEKLPGFRLEKEDFIPIWQGDTKALSQQQVADIVLEHPEIPTGIRLIQIAVDELEERARLSLKSKHAKLVENEGAGLRDLTPAEKEESAALQTQYGGAYAMIEKCGWLNIDRIGQRLLGLDHLNAVEWYYLKMALTGECDRVTQYVMIDEVQDYSEAQLMVLERYFANARFMLLGDEFQAIRKGTVTFEEIHRLFEERNRKVTELPLLTSYRSSPEITELFTSLLPRERRILTRSVQRPGTRPVIRALDTREAYNEALQEAVLAAGKEEGLTAVICDGQSSIDRTAALLGKSVPLITRGSQKLPAQGVVLIDLVMAKGLEFDGVILADADEHHYPATLLGRHKFYTAASRATQRLTVLAEKALTSLLTPRSSRSC